MKSTDEQWKDMLTGAHPVARLESKVWRMLPANPRCKLCYAPFSGTGGKILSFLGRRPWKKNPSLCNVCQAQIERNRGGTEIDLTLLFADIRGSTALAETMSATRFNALLSDFYNATTDVLVSHLAWIDKFVGDEVVAFFFANPVAGTNHARTGINAAQLVLSVLSERRIPVGIGVHTGTAYVGTVGGEQVSDVTAVGDDVNVTARLAAAADAGTIVLSVAACSASGLSVNDWEQKDLTVKGKSVPIAVRILRG